jgi:hypothetical protein
MQSRYLYGFDRRVGRTFGMITALFLASGPAFGDDDDFAGPLAPVPNITLEQCIGACFGQPIHDPIGKCQGLIGYNLYDLKDKYEISAPTEGMGCALDSTSQYIQSIIGTPYVNPFANPLQSDDVGYQIYEIEHEGYEIVEQEPGHKYTGRTINDRLTTLHDMQSARMRLIARFNNLQDVFTNDLPWPKFVDVGPNVWPITACVAVNDPRNIASRAAYDRFYAKVGTYAANPKLSPFAFYKDWYDLTFAGLGQCGSHDDSIITPFYGQPTAEVQKSKDNLLGTLYTTKHLAKRLVDLGSSLDEAERHTQLARYSFAGDFATEIRATYAVAVSQLKAASDAYVQLRQDKQAYDSYASKEVELKATLDAIDTSIPNASLALTRGEEDFHNAEVAAQTAQSFADQASATVDKSRIAISTVTLQCNGRTYKCLSGDNLIHLNRL